MDYFKIVATMEKRGIYFTLIPHKWEKNKTMFWPQHLRHSERELLRSDPKSEPEDSWVRFKCVVKLTKIKTFEEGLNLEKQFTECTDTEAEEALFEKTNQSENLNVNDGTALTNNRNYMFEDSSGSTAVLNIAQPIIDLNVPINSYSNVENNGQNTILYLNEAEPNVTACGGDEICKMREELTSFKKEVKNELQIIKEELTTIVKENCTKIITYLDQIYKSVDNIPNAHVTREVDGDQNIFAFPLSTIEEIDKMDFCIRTDEKYKSQLIKALSKIGGTSGQEDGTKIGYKVIDHVFTSQILLNYSWTGVSRATDVEKKCFQNLQGILDVFFQVILLADNRHTKQKNANIFKDGVLKHAKKRSLRKRPLLLSREEEPEENENSETKDTEHNVEENQLES